jgi:hypothetical protein
MNENASAKSFDQIIFRDSEHKYHLLGKKGYGPVASSPLTQSQLELWAKRIVPRMNYDPDYNYPDLSYLPYGGEAALIRRVKDVLGRPTMFLHVVLCSAESFSPMEALRSWRWPGWCDPQSLSESITQLPTLDAGDFKAAINAEWRLGDGFVPKIVEIGQLFIELLLGICGQRDRFAVIARDDHVEWRAELVLRLLTVLEPGRITGFSTHESIYNDTAELPQLVFASRNERGNFSISRQVIDLRTSPAPQDQLERFATILGKAYDRGASSESVMTVLRGEYPGSDEPFGGPDQLKSLQEFLHTYYGTQRNAFADLSDLALVNLIPTLVEADLEGYRAELSRRAASQRPLAGDNAGAVSEHLIMKRFEVAHLRGRLGLRPDTDPIYPGLVNLAFNRNVGAEYMAGAVEEMIEAGGFPLEIIKLVQTLKYPAGLSRLIQGELGRRVIERLDPTLQVENLIEPASEPALDSGQAVDTGQATDAGQVTPPVTPPPGSRMSGDGDYASNPSSDWVARVTSAPALSSGGTQVTPEDGSGAVVAVADPPPGGIQPSVARADGDGSAAASGLEGSASPTVPRPGPEEPRPPSTGPPEVNADTQEQGPQQTGTSEGSVGQQGREPDIRSSALKVTEALVLLVVILGALLLFGKL